MSQCPSTKPSARRDAQRWTLTAARSLSGRVSWRAKIVHPLRLYFLADGTIHTLQESTFWDKYIYTLQITKRLEACSHAVM